MRIISVVNFWLMLPSFCLVDFPKLSTEQKNAYAATMLYRLLDYEYNVY